MIFAEGRACRVIIADQSGPGATSGAGIEALHHIRDVAFGEDISQARTGNGRRVMATLRNVGTAIRKLSAYRNIAAACRDHARDATRALAALELTPT